MEAGGGARWKQGSGSQEVLGRGNGCYEIYSTLVSCNRWLDDIAAHSSTQMPQGTPILFGD